jgi:hypothetical protein
MPVNRFGSRNPNWLRGELLLPKKYTKYGTPLFYLWNTQCPTNPIGEEMTTSRFTPSANEAALRRRLAHAIYDAGLSDLISVDNVLITEDGFTLGTFDLSEMSNFAKTLEDIARLAAVQRGTNHQQRTMDAVLQESHQLPAGYTRARVVKSPRVHS